MDLKVIAFNGSPRKQGNTHIAIETVFKELEEQGIETEEIKLADYQINGCTACYACIKNKDNKCIQTDDFNQLYQKMLHTDCTIIGSPVYVAGVTGPTKCFIDRAGFVNRVNELPLKRKVGAGVVVYTRAGAVSTLSQINNFILGVEMVLVVSSYWCLAQGSSIGAILEDEWGMNTFKRLGQNIAWLLKKLNP